MNRDGPPERIAELTMEFFDYALPSVSLHLVDPESVVKILGEAIATLKTLLDPDVRSIYGIGSPEVE